VGVDDVDLMDGVDRMEAALPLCAWSRSARFVRLSVAGRSKRSRVRAPNP